MSGNGVDNSFEVNVRAMLEGKSFELWCYTDFKLRARSVLRVTRLKDDASGNPQLRLEILEMEPECTCPNWPHEVDEECANSHNDKRRIFLA